MKLFSPAMLSSDSVLACGASVCGATSKSFVPSATIENACGAFRRSVSKSPSTSAALIDRGVA